MQFNFDSGVPLFQQVNDQIEEGILDGTFPELTQIPSTTEISQAFKINPATVLKGVNLLVANGLVEKRRGIGVFVKQGAQEQVRTARKAKFLEEAVTQIVQQAQELNISKTQLIKLIESRYQA
ncbi:GntR family transcriptional regulator [Agrilactobacillus fermenti]|uniref:GntR family transcriptional regulator n=1 Tax=Agrilactobacillus fermenti TaxID=2586909 RepID=UPI001E52B6AE|nr:GntR family transcriptional regulator [Agrilactobacillus fermenti]MCD2257056.1 GntR family transcriptional regulator [Agrilactobacillus fermenti]